MRTRGRTPGYKKYWVGSLGTSRFPIGDAPALTGSYALSVFFIRSEFILYVWFGHKNIYINKLNYEEGFYAYNYITKKYRKMRLAPSHFSHQDGSKHMSDDPERPMSYLDLRSRSIKVKPLQRDSGRSCCTSVGALSLC